MPEAVYVVKSIQNFKRKMRSLYMLPSDRTHISNPFIFFLFGSVLMILNLLQTLHVCRLHPALQKKYYQIHLIYISRTLCDMKRKNVLLTPDLVITNSKRVSINSKSHNRLDSKKTEYQNVCSVSNAELKVRICDKEM